MKSFSNDIADTQKITQLEGEISSLKDKLTITFIFGIAGFIFACLSLLLGFFTVDRTALFAKETRDRLTHLEQTHKE